MYTMRIDMFARAEPLVFTSDDLKRHDPTQMQELISKMESMDPEEATAQVHETYQFDLCYLCRSVFHKQLSEKKKDKG